MAAEIVNLRRARKDRARSEREKKADANRLAFGRTRVEKEATTSAADARERQLDGHRIDDK